MLPIRNFSTREFGSFLIINYICNRKSYLKVNVKVQQTKVV